MASPSSPREARLLLAANDYSPIPTNGKIPHCKGWPDWKHREPDVIKKWDMGYRDHQNTSILTYEAPFLDIDVYLPEAAQAVEDMVTERFDGYVLPLRFGQRPKRGFLFQISGDPFGKIVDPLVPPTGDDGRKHGCEFLCDGNQAVVHGIHPDAGYPYAWHKGSPFELRRDELLGMTGEMARQLHAEATEMLIRDFGYSRAKPKKANGETAFSDGFGAFDWEALHRDPLDHDALRDTIMALQVAGTHDGAIYNFMRAGIISAKTTDEPRRQRRLEELPGMVKGGRAKIDARAATPPPPFSGWSSAAELQGKIFMPLKWIIPRYIPEGVTLLAGKPKVGKSWLMLATSLAVACADLVLCEHCEQRTVLYCALEDNERRMQARIDKLIGSSETWPENLGFVYDLPTIGNGGIERLEEYIKSRPVDLIIIDTLARFRGSKRKDEDNYQADYRTMAELHNLGRRTGVSIIVVHHVRKATADDLFDTISGTMGLSGAADTLVILTRTDDQNSLRLATRGRDVEPEDKIVAFDSDMGEWTVVEDYEPEERGTGTTASSIAAVLVAHGFGMSPKQVAEKIGAKEAAVRQALWRMSKAGKVRKNQYGVYEAV